MTDDSLPRTIVIGLGNPILGDDGVGWRVVEKVRVNLVKAFGEPSQGFEVDTLSGGGLNLMERLVGYDRAILVDAMQSGQSSAGAVSVFPLETLENPFAGHLGSTHETNLQTALEIGRNLGVQLPAPGKVLVVAIEAQKVFEFSEELSLPVAAAVGKAVEEVFRLLSQATHFAP
jgi:hydrogenase maturation protease